MAGITGIGGEKFSDKPGDWPETKMEIIGWFEASGYSYIAKTGTILFHFAGSGDHDHLEDGDLEGRYAYRVLTGSTHVLLPQRQPCVSVVPLHFSQLNGQQQLRVEPQQLRVTW